MLRLVGPDYVPSEADVYRVCGKSHVLVIEEVVVNSPEELEQWREGQSAEQG